MLETHLELGLLLFHMAAEATENFFLALTLSFCSLDGEKITLWSYFSLFGSFFYIFHTLQHFPSRASPLVLFSFIIIWPGKLPHSNLVFLHTSPLCVQRNEDLVYFKSEGSSSFSIQEITIITCTQQIVSPFCIFSRKSESQHNSSARLLKFIHPFIMIKPGSNSSKVVLKNHRC